MNAALFRIVQGLLIVALLWLPETASARNAAGIVEIEDCKLKKEALTEGLSTVGLRVVDVQHVLHDIYGVSKRIRDAVKSDELDDGVLGTQTMLWAEQFCRDFMPKSKLLPIQDLIAAFEQYRTLDNWRAYRSYLFESDEFLDSVDYHGQLEKVFHGTDRILVDKRFLSWIKEPWQDSKAAEAALHQADPESGGNYRDLLRQLRRFGSPAVVDALLREFSAARPGDLAAILADDQQSRTPMEEQHLGPRTYYRLGQAAEQTRELQPIKDVAYPSHRLLLDAATAALNGFEPTSHDKQARDRAALLAPADETRRSIKEAPEPYPAVTIDTEGCGCAPEFNSVTYGILPPWLAKEIAEDEEADGDEEVAEPPRYPVNFGLLNRIGFLDLVLDDEGRRVQSERWDPRFDAGGFIAKAHRYNTEVDMIVRVRDMLAGTNENEDMVEKAVEEIVDRLRAPRPPLQRTDIGWLEWFQDLFDLDRWYGSELDGVTILFDDPQALKENADVAEPFLKQLLKALDGEYQLNIALNARPEDAETALASIADVIKIEEARKEETSLTPFLELMLGYETTIDPRIDLILLFMPEPTTETKKILRARLDASDTFKGSDRQELLRRIVAVIPPNGHDRDDFTQFEDDLDYFRGNYKGVGFWPLPRQAETEPDEFETLILDQFTQGVSNGFLMQVLITLGKLQWCDGICPNRILFRSALGLITIVVLAIGIRRLLSCNFRERTARYRALLFIIPLAVAGILLVLLLTCDPDLRGMGGRIAALIIVFGIVMKLGRLLAARRGEVP